MNDITADILTVSVLEGRIRHRNELRVLGLDYSDIVDSKGTVHGDRSKSLEGLAVLDDLADFHIKLHTVFPPFLLDSYISEIADRATKKTGKAFAFSALCAHFITLPAPVAF